jgi:hypothetical protein
MVKCLLDHKAWVDYESCNQENALCLAARHNHIQSLYTLLPYNPRFYSRGTTTSKSSTTSAIEAQIQIL